MSVANPIIKLIPDIKSELDNLNYSLVEGTKEEELIKNYPTVYIHNWEKSDKFEVYIGESNDFFQRTQQHYDEMNNPKSWQKYLKYNDASLFVIAHPEFNKSLTLDVENKLIHYLSSSSSVAKVHNARGNPQNKYYPCEEFDAIFSKIWKSLRRYNKALFLSESEIKDSAIYKASPLHKLNFEQRLAKEKIVDKISECLIKDKEHQLILVKGDAGTGKTVLMSSIFYDMLGKNKVNIEDETVKEKDIDCAIIVNHLEQLTVYDEITKKLDLCRENENIVFKPTQFINLFKNNKRKKLFDVAFVDEAHLLWTQNNQAFTDNNQLQAIMKYAKVIVVMFDEKQIMNAEQYLSKEEIESYINLAKSNDSYIELREQMRITASKEVTNWLKNIYINGKINKLSNNRKGYDIKVFDSPKELEMAIKKKALDEKTLLSRLIASYDWPYTTQQVPKDNKYWCVKIGNWSRPWNREIARHEDSKFNKKLKGLAWAEQPQTINEVGSTYTIQGFDLNYAGVILGPSIKYRDGKVIFDPKQSCNEKATRRRTISSGELKSFGEDFLKNELSVLLTRGVNGLYIYACDEELRKALKKNI